VTPGDHDRDNGFERDRGHERNRDRGPDHGRNTEGGRGRSTRRRHWLQVLDALVYSIAVAGLLTLAASVLSVGFGGGLVGAKYLLFLVGFALFAVGAIGMRPTPAWKDGDSAGIVGLGEETRFQGTLHRLPPLRRYDLAPAERLSAGAKLFITSLLVLGTSFVFETVFGVAA
jgi:FtsH-binding integral membrane protein